MRTRVSRSVLTPAVAAEGRASMAWPLAAAWLVLIIYASLFPFAGWRSTGIPWHRFVLAPLPHYWTWFDIISNVLGYAPLGFLVMVGIHRNRWQPAGVGMVLLVAVMGSALSGVLEVIQNWLPGRVPSNLDWALNSAGGLLGALLAHVLVKAGALGHWSAVRERWLAPDAGGSLVLLLLWPVALLYPLPVPFGLGQILERLENLLALWLAGTPWIQWLPVRAIEFQPMLPLVELMVVALGLLVPCLLAYGVLRTRWQRLVAGAVVVLAGVLLTALTSVLTFGPDMAWGWLWKPVRVGLLTGALLGLMGAFLPRRACWVAALLALVLQLQGVNDASVSAYYDQSLQAWEQGGFIRVYGLTQWLGWLWPFATLVHLMQRLATARRTPQGPGLPPA